MAEGVEILEAAIIVLTIILTVAGNLFVCAIIYRVRSLHCPSGLLLANLAVNEILVGFFLLPFGIRSTLTRRWVHSSALCQLNGFLQHSLSSVSVLTLLAVSVDRYLAILTPLRYKVRVTNRRCVVVITGTWLYALFSGCYPFLGWSRYEFIPGLWLCESDYQKSVSFTYVKLASIYFLPFLTILAIYASILRVSRRHSKQIRQEVEAARQREIVANVREGFGSTNGGYCLRKPHSAIKKEIRTALILAAIVGVLFISWAPYMMLNLWSLHSGRRASVLLQSVVSRLYYANGAINPFLYGALNQRIRRQFVVVWELARGLCVRVGQTRVQPA